MSSTVFVPGHISCIFRPVRDEDVLRTGSRGFGIRLDLGCRATVTPRTDGRIVIRMNGEEAEAPITRRAVESLAEGRGFDIDMIHDLPSEQGFGTSASGTYAAALCVCDLMGKGPLEAVKATHTMECSMGGGMGDILAIHSSCGVPVRTEAGCPGICGSVEDSGVSMDEIALIVFDEPLKTASVLSDEREMGIIAEAGDEAMAMFDGDRTVKGLFKAANHFSERIGLESEEVRKGMEAIRSEGYPAGMCMLGNSIYTTAPREILERLFPKERLYFCSSFGEPIGVTRTE